MKTFYTNTLQMVSDYQIKFYITAYSLILLMAAAAFTFQEKEIILPELAALSIGCFLYKKNTWTSKPMHLFLLPVATAFIGFFINQFEVNIAVKIILVLMVMFILLHLVKSSLAPALATGLLPIVTNCDSYVFLISIVFFMGLLAFLTYVLFKQQTSKEVQDETKSSLLVLLYLAVLILWVILCYVVEVMQMAAIPPLIVLGYELIQKKQYSFKMMYKQVLALTATAFVGAQSIYFFDHYFLAAVINIIAVTIILHLLKMKMPPVYGMVMLPMVLPGYSPVYFAVNVAVTSLVLLGIIYFFINRKAFKTAK